MAIPSISGPSDDPDPIRRIKKIPAIPNMGDKQELPHQFDAESNDPAVRAEQERQRQEYLKALEILRQKQADDAEEEGGINIMV